MPLSLASSLLEWYRANARPMPWRDDPTPYAVWISEIMLQQTRVDTVRPYFERWMAQFPDIHSLANANLQDVLACWEGLGYYTRARNLHKTAALLVKIYGGLLPSDAAELRKLPGIGAYTAGAIASIAFGKDEPVLDGNVRRVVSRLFDLQIPADSREGQARLWEDARRILPQGEAGDFNQALMELGATLCKPRQPDCALCPLAPFCLARERGVQDDRPILKPKPQVPSLLVTAAVIRKGDTVLIAQRPENGLLGGLWEFPGGKVEPGEDLPACLRREIMEELGVQIRVGESVGKYKHAYTHFKVTLHAFYAEILSGKPQPIGCADLRWVFPADLPTFPMGKIDRQIAKHLLASSKWDMMK